MVSDWLLTFLLLLEYYKASHSIFNIILEYLILFPRILYNLNFLNFLLVLVFILLKYYFYLVLDIPI